MSIKYSDLTNKSMKFDFLNFTITKESLNNALNNPQIVLTKFDNNELAKKFESGAIELDSGILKTFYCRDLLPDYVTGKGYLGEQLLVKMFCFDEVITEAIKECEDTSLTTCIKIKIYDTYALKVHIVWNFRNNQLKDHRLYPHVLYKTAYIGIKNCSTMWKSDKDYVLEVPEKFLLDSEFTRKYFMQKNL